MKSRFTALAALSVLVLLPAGLSAHPPDTPQLEVLAAFNPAALETPESIAFDRDGNTYVSLALTGEIRRIAPDGTQSTLIQFPIGPPLTFCGPFFNAVTGITIDPHDDTIYASAVACDLASRGVWRVEPDGTGHVVATLPLASIPNGIALYRGFLYVADSSPPDLARAGRWRGCGGVDRGPAPRRRSVVGVAGSQRPEDLSP